MTAFDPRFCSGPLTTSVTKNASCRIVGQLAGEPSCLDSKPRRPASQRDNSRYDRDSFSSTAAARSPTWQRCQCQKRRALDASP